MKPGPYAVSVIWGEGHHYFVGHHLTREEAAARAKAEFARLSKIKRAPKLRVIVWCFAESVQGDDVEPLRW